VGLLGTTALADSGQVVDANEWTLGRGMVTVGGVLREGQQSILSPGRTESVEFPFRGQLTQVSVSGAYFARPWFGVGLDLRIDPFAVRLDSPQANDRYVRSSGWGVATALFRWQIISALGLEAHVGWMAGSRPKMVRRGGTDCRQDTGTGLYCATDSLATGPAGGVAVALDLGRWLSLLTFGRVDQSFGLTDSETYGRWSGPGLTLGAWARVGSVRLGFVDVGAALMYEMNTTQLRGESVSPTEARFTVHRLGLGLSFTARQVFENSTSQVVSQSAVKGRVIRSDRSLVPNAAVVIGAQTLMTDANGRFELVLTPGTYDVRVTAPGFRPLNQSVSFSETIVSLELMLETPTGPGRITGVVRSAPNKPVAQAKVTTESASTTSSANGSFVLERVGPGPVKVRIELEGYAAADEVVQVPPESDATLEVTLEATAARSKAKIRGLVSSATGPVAKATVRIVELKMKQVVKPDGRFEADVAGGKYTLVIEAPKHVTQTRIVEVADGDQAIFQIELEKTR
jgi:hypothetical protein